MITLPLRIRYSEKPLRQADAWFIPGPDPSDWIGEMLHWEISLADVALYAIPCSPADRKPQGALAVVSAGSRPYVSSRCQPYGRIGQAGHGKSVAVLYMPIEAHFDPDASDAEVVALLPSNEKVYLWHPAYGLFGFEPDDKLNVADLLQIPPERKSLWDRAEPVLDCNRRLTAIEPDYTVSLEEVLNAGQEDIGSQSSALDELPPSPDEPRPGLMGFIVQAGMNQLAKLKGRGGGDEDALPPSSQETHPAGSREPSPGMFARMTRAVKQFFARLTQRNPKNYEQSSSKKKSAGWLTSWFERKLNRIREKIISQRHRETLRLMHLLETDPDVGLRYALLFNAGEHRGVAPPGSKLVPHGTDFNIRRIGGSGPADPWDLPYDLRQKMLAKYHELAGRELRLGRYRRAAYIYAELLGDIDAAASALIAGKHCREAAVLYRDRLHRPEQAARCLEQGGLWTEAIALYEELTEFEKVGDLYRQLDQPEHAERAYRSAVDKQLAWNDYQAAARILEEKLCVPDEALQQLETGWSSSNQAGNCLREQFRLLARLGRHEAAADIVEQLRRQSYSVSRMQLLADVLSLLATTYPAASVQTAAADATRTLVATRLRKADSEEKRRLLESVRRLVPADRLLDRDCRRFLQLRAQISKPAEEIPVPNRCSASSGSTPMRLTPIGQIELSPKNSRWQAADSIGNVFYAACYQGNNFLVKRGCWDGDRVTPLQEVQWQGVPFARRPVLLAAGMQSLAIHIVGSPPLPLRHFPATDELPTRVEVCTPSWFPADTVAVYRTAAGTTHLLQRQTSGFVLHLFDYKNRPLGSSIIPYFLIWPETTGTYPPFESLPLHGGTDATYFAMGDRLVIVKDDTHMKIVNLPGIAYSLQGSWPFSRVRLIATMDQGAVLYWDDSAMRLATFATELDRPVVRFTKGGWLVAASAAECQVYRTDGQRIRLEATCPGGNIEPLAVLNTLDPDQFAVFGLDGVIRLYQMPHR